KNELLHNLHFVNQMCCTCILVDDEQNISRIHINGSLQFRVKNHVACHCFDVSIKCQANQLSFSVQYRRTEERRVGKESRSRWSPGHYRKRQTDMRLPQS